MHKAKLRTVGGSTMVAIPPAALQALDLGPNSDVEIHVEDDRLVIEPRRTKGRIGLAARLAMCDFSKPEAADEREILDAPRVGREEI